MNEPRHFCTCPVTQCPRNPSNHSKGCDPCILDNLQKRKMPACFYSVVNEDVSGVTDYSIEGFVKFFLENQNNGDSTLASNSD